MKHGDELLRCLVEMDVAAARRLFAHVFPHMHQPESDEDMRLQMHLARVQTKRVPQRLRIFSRHWLKERSAGRIALAVGISVVASGPRRKRQAIAVREAMEDAVRKSLKDGLDLDADAKEVQRRLIAARDKELGI